MIKIFILFSLVCFSFAHPVNGITHTELEWSKHFGTKIQSGYAETLDMDCFKKKRERQLQNVEVPIRVSIYFLARVPKSTYFLNRKISLNNT